MQSGFQLPDTFGKTIRMILHRKVKMFPRIDEEDDSETSIATIRDRTGRA